jgi:hypothetical protein
MNILYYEAISEFKRQFYRDWLTLDNVTTSGLVHIPKLVNTDTSEDLNFWGYVLEKNGVKYLLSSRDTTNKEIILKNVLPLKVVSSKRVASKGLVYEWIQAMSYGKFKALKTKSFKELVDSLSVLKHSNPTHQKLNWFIGITQMFDRANFRIATPPGFGKDSTVDILGNIIGGAATIENPTIAKLEFMTNYKWLAVNEVIDISKSEWRNIEQFLLAAGAHKPELTKHSRAMIKGVTEILDISKFSISIMYNDIDRYPEATDYFDFITKDAVKDRFVALRLNGVLQEDFNSSKGTNMVKFVEENMDKYRDLICNFTYYKENRENYIKHFKVTGLIDMPERWQTNLGRLFKIIDMYCTTQEEFNLWVEVVNKCMVDYKDMLKYPDMLEKFKRKHGQKKTDEAVTKCEQMLTFSERLQLLSTEQIGVYKDINPNDFWEEGVKNG